MNLKNNLVNDLLKKDRNISMAAAKTIIDTADLDAWVCLIENADYILDFIKRNAAQKLFSACNPNNISNLLKFLDYHHPDYDDFIASALVEFGNQDISNKIFDLLSIGTNQQKAYAAKFFCFANSPEAKEALFESSQSEYKPLADNCAMALGEMKDETSFNYYLELLSSDDEWKVLSAAQFLSLYNNQEALLPMLRAMSESTMSEHIAGEIASFAKLNELFRSQNDEIKELSMECFDNILSGLVQIWPLSVLFNFEIKSCIETLFDMLQQNDNLTTRCSQLLLKAKNRIELFYENDEYKYDEDKNTLQELDDIYQLLNSYPEAFWEAQIDNLFEEVENGSKKRKIAALNLIADLKVDYATQEIINCLKDSDDENILCELIITLSNIGGISNISNKDEILAKITNENLKAIAENIFLTSV
jgi:hypothetical protein